MNSFFPQSQAGFEALSGIGESEIDDGVDAVEAYFECITTCSLDDQECITVCTTKLRDHS
jgi:hypothetical protein